MRRTGGAVRWRPGLRCSEVAALCWADVDLSAGDDVVVTLRRSKTKPPSERVTLRHLGGGRAAGGLEGRRTTHSGRAGLAMELNARGAGAREVQRAGGWKDPAMVARYAVAGSTRDVAVNRLMPRSVGGKSHGQG